MTQTRLRILMLGAFKPDYSRNHVIRAGLERVGVEVTLEAFPTEMPSLHRILRVIRRFPRDGQYDVVIVPMSNQIAAPVYWLLGKVFGQPVLLDYFLGLTDLNEDRRNVSGWKAWLYRAVDRFNIARMDSITDTAAHREAFRALVGVEPARMGVIPVGINDGLFQRLPLTPEGEGILAQFVGTFIPFQGVDVILRAAAQLKDDTRIHFEIIGDGQTYREARALAAELDLTNVAFLSFVPYAELAAKMRRSSVQLGVFGDSYKTSYVVPNKVYEGLALGLPMITAESAALNEFFTPGEHLLTVSPGDPAALAEAIRQLAGEPDQRARLGEAAATRVHEAFLPEHIGALIRGRLEDLLTGKL